MVIDDKVKAFLKTKRFYVFYEDGTWRTATEDQWKDEQLWKLNPSKSGWYELSEFDLQVITSVIKRYEHE